MAASIRVRRFPVTQPRDPRTFGSWSERVFAHQHSIADELAWLDAEGPTSPALIRHLTARQRTSTSSSSSASATTTRTTACGPCPEGDPRADGRARCRPGPRDLRAGVPRAVRALMYNSPEERALHPGRRRHRCGPWRRRRRRLGGAGIGKRRALPPEVRASASAFAIYIGRIDENKGCAELFDFFDALRRRSRRDGLTLVLIGTPILPIPAHPRIRHLGFVGDEDKFDAIAAAEFLLIMPSYFESLSMVALEAWALGKPVLANGQCDVLRGQCRAQQRRALLRGLRGVRRSGTACSMARAQAGRRPRPERPRASSARTTPGRSSSGSTSTMFERLSHEDAGEIGRHPAPELPGWWARRQTGLPPAREILAGLPAGPVLTREPRETRDTRGARDARDGRDTRDGREPRPVRAPVGLGATRLGCAAVRPGASTAAG